MKSFQQFMEQPEIINMMRGFAQQNKKSPKELKSMRDGIINTVGKKLGGKLDLGGIMNKIPSSQEMQDNMKKAQTGLSKKLNDPSTQQKFDNFSRMLKSLSTEK